MVRIIASCFGGLGLDSLNGSDCSEVFLSLPLFLQTHVITVLKIGCGSLLLLPPKFILRVKLQLIIISYWVQDGQT
jgi:hypothetical protein